MSKVHQVISLSKTPPPRPPVNKMQQVFEALMSSKGYTDFSMNKKRYTSASMQVRWSYFQMGWSMREITS
jgi:hypothetical protein